MDDSFMRLTGMQVISGGQTGVDLAALRAAQCMGFRTGGQAPMKWRTQVGPKPELTFFGLTEGTSFTYTERTETNVTMSDATLLIYQHGDSPGTAQTRKFAKALDRPLFEVQVGATLDMTVLEKWVKTCATRATALYGGFSLNVAGNSSQTAPNIFVQSFLMLLTLFKNLAAGGDKQDDADRKALFANLQNPQLYMQLVDRFDYIPQLDFRNRHNGTPICLYR
jgi:hypothetical protein